MDGFRSNTHLRSETYYRTNRQTQQAQNKRRQSGFKSTVGGLKEFYFITDNLNPFSFSSSSRVK